MHGRASTASPIHSRRPARAVTSTVIVSFPPTPASGGPGNASPDAEDLAFALRVHLGMAWPGRVRRRPRLFHELLHLVLERCHVVVIRLDHDLVVDTGHVGHHPRFLAELTLEPRRELGGHAWLGDEDFAYRDHASVLSSRNV